MDIATRMQTRSHAQAFSDHDSRDDSSVDSASVTQRKQTRVINDTDDGDSTFKKPVAPASASRPVYMEQRASFTRRPGNVRENVRVPSGPRDYPSPQKRQGSVTSAAPPLIDRSMPRDSKLNVGAHRERISNGSSDDSIAPADLGDDFHFVPSINFDDFQDSMGISNYDSAGSLLGEFPGVPASRHHGKEISAQAAKSQGARGSGVQSTEKDHGRTPSLTQKHSSLRGYSGSRQVSGSSSGSAAPTNFSTRTRRQSSVPQASLDPPGLPAKGPRKSVGPGVISSMTESRKPSLTAPSLPGDLNKPPPQRNGSLNKARRTTMQPPAAPRPDSSRVSTATATTQSRANKAKSMIQTLQTDLDPNTPTSLNAARASKGSQNRAHTPSSSGSKRQSTISGRASGLGARTISPTDARRMKRASMMPAPPLPATVPSSSPHDDLPSPLTRPPEVPEMPRIAQPSPSFIPRMTSNATPTSGRTSPEGRSTAGGGGGVSLNPKSSYQSLLAQATSSSRLPTPKVRNLHSSSGNHNDEEMVPPVPAIPKAFESPRESHVQPFATGSKSSLSNLGSQSGRIAEPNADGQEHADVSQRQPEARSHRRTHTVDRINTSAGDAGSIRRAPDLNGRKNNSLQPLTLPPLKLTSMVNDKKASARPGEQTDEFDDWMGVHTPEPKRGVKTPSTPMTASKAAYWKRHEEQKTVRSSSSHFALRDVIQLDDTTSRFFDDSDMEALGLKSGVDFPEPKTRSTVTPFASGSLPKGTSEYIKLAGRPSADYDTERDAGGFTGNLHLQHSKTVGQRPRTTQHAISGISTEPEFHAPEPKSQLDIKDKKESAGAGLRRKLSLGWKRSSSKASNHPDNKNSPTSSQDDAGQKSLKERNKLHKRLSEMPPPRLPASASMHQWPPNSATFPPTENLTLLPASSRPSLDSAIRRKSAYVGASNSSSSNLILDSSEALVGAGGTLPGVKTRSQHSEQPQPVGTSHRASSWSLRTPDGRQAIPPAPKGPAPVSKHRWTPSTLSAAIKDVDDMAADDEMRRLSQKRKDVDSAARESEKLKARAVPRSPVTAERVLHDRNCSLNIFERGEIMDYEKDGIFFTGTPNAKKVIGSVSAAVAVNSIDKTGNFGYDDERGDYNIVMGDHLAYRYEVVDILGKGSFGQVVRCVDHKEGGVVAVKIIRNKKRFHQQALVEVGILGRLRDWDPDGDYATLSITSSFYFRSHLCIVTPCLSINLYELIRAHNFSGFSIPLIRRFARQLLACLVLLQRKRIIHCDLKPENILLCEARKADVRVIDFGSSCKEEEKVYTYIQSRFYRSPEVILGSSYGLGIDMWSFGCILAELWTGYPIFPGENEQEQLACIMEIFGPPDRHLVERCTRKKLFFDSVGKPRVTVSSKGRRRRPSSKTLAQALKSDDEAFIDFIARCLRWDPDRRLKPAEAVSHPFIANQPLVQRPTIPDEARRAPRVKPIPVIPSNTLSAATSSPTKRAPASGHFSSQQTAATPARNLGRQPPETPQTAVRAAGMGIAAGVVPNLPPAQGSPNKLAGGVNRRHSTVATAGSAAAVAGSKRTSNGAVLAGGLATPNLAQLAAKESMGSASSQANNSPATRWRG